MIDSIKKMYRGITRSKDSAAQDRALRIALLIGGILLYPPWAIYYKMSRPGSYDPIWLRYIVVSPAALYLLFYPISNFFRKHLYNFYNFNLFFASAHYFFIVYSNNVAPIYRAGTYIMVLIIQTLCVGFRNKLIYGIFSLLAAVGLSYMLEGIYFLQPTRDSSMLVIGLFTCQVFLLISEFGRHRIQMALDAERAKGIEKKGWESLGRLAGGVAHEINSPLAAISLRTELLKMKLEEVQIIEGHLSGKPLAEVTAGLGEIDQIVNRISSVTKALLAIVPKRKLINATEMTVRNVVVDSLARMNHSIEQAGIAIEVNLDKGSDRPFLGHRSELINAVIHLLTNSCEAVSTLSQIDRWIGVFGIARASGEYELKIQDSGKLDDVARQGLFDMFHSTKEVGQALGVGLASARAILQTHGGEIHFDDQAIKTSFSILLPAQLFLLNKK